MQVKWAFGSHKHYRDVIMSAMTSQITSLAIVYPTVYLGADKKKTWKLRVTGFCAGNWPGNSPAQRANNAENVSIWWHHHGKQPSTCATSGLRHDAKGNTFLCFLIHFQHHQGKFASLCPITDLFYVIISKLIINYECTRNKTPVIVSDFISKRVPA